MKSSSAPPRSLWKSRRLSIVLIAVDAVGYSLCWQGAWYLRRALNPILGPINEMAPYLQVHLLIVLVALGNCAAFGLYLHRRRLSSLNRPSVLIKASYHWLLYIVVVGFFFKALDLGRSVILLAALLGVVYLFSSRTVLRWLKARALARGRGRVRSLIVGTGPLAADVRQALADHPEIGYEIVGSVAAPGEEVDERNGTHDLNALGELIAREQIEEIFLAIAHLEHDRQLDLLNLAEHRGIRVHVVSNIFDVITERAKVEEIATFPVITLRDGHIPLHQAMMKAMLDYTLALAGTFLWLAFFHWWIAMRIRMDSPGPVFFRQERIGRDGRPFTLFKYRTMRADAEAYATAPTDEEDPRITPFGRWLRRTSLDELPQLLNVLRGEMSLVGPRPEMRFIVDQYQPWERRRLDVKPGLTGLWQVIGRKNLPLRLNMQYDLYYIKNQSFLLDVEILFRTLPAVLKGKGAF